MRHEYSLDALNFFLANVRQGLGPYLAIYLLTERHWAEDRIGFVITIATLSGLVAQTPAGALTDVSHAKRAIIIAAAFVVTGASILLPLHVVLCFRGRIASGGRRGSSFFRAGDRRDHFQESWGRGRLRAALAATSPSIMLAIGCGGDCWIWRLEVWADHRLLSYRRHGAVIDRERYDD